MDLVKHECRSVISAQANNFAQSTEFKMMVQNNNNENINGHSGIRATSASTAGNCNYDDADNNVGEMSGNLSDSCGSEKMNLSEVKISGQTEDRDKVSGKQNFNFLAANFVIFLECKFYKETVFLLSHKL